ncbi:methyltransferase domain-containing protein [Actinomadura formosensis]|uniref:methyltransferase domain-containing protein n=1 Tax=Actinomadura formosensis TaxID=60706 RepID=UPI00082DBF0E|nr:methyltransferase domain-containing protein [Actinomadura formosensis]
MTSTDELADLLGVGNEWRTAMRAVPRELFVPPTALAGPETGGLYPIDREARPDEWWKAVYSDASIVTQRDDGKGDPLDVQTGFATSSLSAPGIAFRFLELLAPRDLDNVLEIGTGTGYTAALLSVRVGEQNVTSVEVDAEVAQQAITNLAKAGFAPHVVIGDGAAGFLGDAPYDRVHATVAVAEIPYTWVEQTRPGGVIVAPWQPLRGHGLMTRLTAIGDVAHGRFHGPAGYMMLRSHRAELIWQARHLDDADRSGTMLDPRTVSEAGPGLQLAVVDLAPGLAYWEKHHDDGAFSLLLFEVGRPGGSWAACDWEPGNRLYEVLQYGERRLWDELEDAFEWWVRHDGPGVDRFGLTVTPEGDRLWLDEPARLV